MEETECIWRWIIPVSQKEIRATKSLVQFLIGKERLRLPKSILIQSKARKTAHLDKFVSRLRNLVAPLEQY